MNNDALKKTIIRLTRNKGRFPSLQELCNVLNYSEEQVIKSMEALVEDRILERTGDWYVLKTTFQSEMDYPDDIKQDEKNEETKEREMSQSKILSISAREQNLRRSKKMGRRKNKKIAKSSYGISVYIIQASMGIIGCGAAIISIYYTTIWFFEFLHWSLALMFSSIMVGFSIFAFETIILFMTGQVTRSKPIKLFISVGFVVLWMIVTSFSIMSTVAGQYNKHTANLRSKIKTEGKENVSYALVKERKKELFQRLSEYRNQVTTLNKIISGMSDLETRTKNSELWKDSQYRLYLANKNIRRVNRQLDKARKEEQKLIDERKKSGTLLVGIDTKKEIPDFYGWLSGIFKIDEDKVQFSMSLFPAIFVDIISPIGIALALFLRNKYR